MISTGGIINTKLLLLGKAVNMAKLFKNKNPSLQSSNLCIFKQKPFWKIKPTRSSGSRLPFSYLLFGDVKNNLADIASSFNTLQNTALTASTIFF